MSQTTKLTLGSIGLILATYTLIGIFFFPRSAVTAFPSAQETLFGSWISFVVFTSLGIVLIVRRPWGDIIAAGVITFSVALFSTFFASLTSSFAILYSLLIVLAGLIEHASETRLR